MSCYACERGAFFASCGCGRAAKWEERGPHREVLIAELRPEPTEGVLRLEIGSVAHGYTGTWLWCAELVCEPNPRDVAYAAARGRAESREAAKTEVLRRTRAWADALRAAVEGVT